MDGWIQATCQHIDIRKQRRRTIDETIAAAAIVIMEHAQKKREHKARLIPADSTHEIPIMINRQLAQPAPVPADAPRELNVALHNRHALGVNGAQVPK